MAWTDTLLYPAVHLVGQLCTPGTKGGQCRDRLTGKPPMQPGQERSCRLVRPLQVVDQDDQRAARRDTFEEREKHVNPGIGIDRDRVVRQVVDQ